MANRHRARPPAGGAPCPQIRFPAPFPRPVPGPVSRPRSRRSLRAGPRRDRREKACSGRAATGDQTRPRRLTVPAPPARPVPVWQCGAARAARRAGGRRRDAQVVPSDEKPDIGPRHQPPGTAHPPPPPASGDRTPPEHASHLSPAPPFGASERLACAEGAREDLGTGIRRQARMPAARIKAATVVTGSPAGRTPSRGCQRP